MVDAVSIVSVQGTALRLGSQGGSASAAPPVPAAPVEEGFISSHIRIDNLQNVAILEYVSSKTGEVVRQYPSQAQINAFKRAQSLQAEAPEARAIESGSPPPAAPRHTTESAPQSQAPAPAPHQAQAAAPAPVPASTEGAGGSTTSVLV